MVIDLDTNKYKLVDPKKVVGAKSGDKPRKAVIAEDSVASVSTAKILYGLSEGEISGIVGNAKGIYLEDTPLQDDSGNNNFENVVYDFRSGTVDQTYIKGFPDVSNELPVNVELKSTTAWIKAINKPELSAVRIRLAWNGLKSQNLDNGDVSGYKIEYAIDVKTDTGAYGEVLNTFINDKVSGKYERTHRINLPKASTGWQIRVRRLTANQNKENIVDKMFIESITEVIDIKLRYPNTALLGLQYDAKTFSRIAKIAVRARGKLISIPTNYDTTTGKYVGLWNGTFKQVYSNNPAWVFYDIVTSKRYGLGKRIDKSMLDKWSIYSLGVYCDELIADGEGGLEKRFTCNVYLQSQADAFKVLQQLSGIFRSLSYWNGEQIVLDADVPKDPVYTFSRANVVDGNFEYSGTRARDRHTVAKVAFDNPNEGYKTEYEYIRDEAAIAKFGINIVDISAIGCTSRAQAQRAGLWALKSEQLETRTVSFKTGLEGFIPQVGNVIEVSDELLAGRANGGRIASVSANGKVVTLDREITVAINDFIIVNGKDGISQKRKVINVSGKLVTVSAAFDNIESGAVYAIRAKDLDTMKFRVMTIKPDDNNVFSITALQHEPLKYNAIDYGTDVKPTNITTNLPSNIVPLPSPVYLSANYRVVQGQTVATLVIQWSQVKEAVSYLVEWRKDSGNWITLPATGNVSAEVDGIYGGLYQARVKAVNAIQASSAYAYSSITTVKSKLSEPKALANLTATGILFGITLNWLFSDGSEDTNYTEIEVATDDLGTNTALVGQFSYPTDNHTINGLQGNLKLFYRARTVDKFGNASEWTAYASATVDASADKVLELLEGQITESQLFIDLQTKIDTIDINSSSIGGINTGLDKAKADIIEANRVIDANKVAANQAIDKAEADIVEANRVIEANRTAANLAIVAANKLIKDNKDKLVLTDADLLAAKTKVTNLETDYNGNKTTVSNTLVSLTNKDISLSADLTKLISDFNGNKAEVVKDLKALVDKDVALTNSYTSLKSDYDGNKAKVDNELVVLVDKDKALTSSIDTLSSEYNTNKAKIVQDLKTLTDKDVSLTNSLTTLESNFNTNKASIVQDLKTLSDKDISLTNSITTLTSTVSDNSSAITANLKTLTDKDKALSDSLVLLQADYDGNKSSVSNKLTALTDKDTSLSNSLTALDSDYKGNKTAIRNELTAVSDKTNSTASSLLTLNSTVESNTASIIANYKTLSDKDTATASKLDGVYAQVNPLLMGDSEALVGNDTKFSGVWSEQSARIEEDLALAIRSDNLQSKLEDNTALISQNFNTLVDRDKALATLITDLDTDYKGNKSSISNKLITLSNTDTTLAADIRNLKSDYDGNKASIRNELTAVSTKIDSTASSLSILSSEFGGNKSAVQNQITVLNNKDISLGQQIATVESTANGNKSSVQSHASSINGLSAQWSIKTDVNGYVSGIGQYNSGSTSVFAVNASQFYISDPSNKTAIVPFMITNGTTINGISVPAGTYIKDAYIANGSIGTAKIGIAQVDTLQIKGQAVSISSAVTKNKPSYLAEWCKGNGTLNEVSTVFEEISIDSGGASVILELYFYGTFVNVTNGSLTGARVMVEFYGRDDYGNITQVQYFRFYRNYEELSTGFKAQFYPPNRNMNYYAKISCFGVSRIDSASYTFSVMTLKK